ncbi:MAG: transposase [Anaerolineales bacterium]
MRLTYQEAASCGGMLFSARFSETTPPDPLRPALLPLLETIGLLTQQIRAYDRQIETLCQMQYPETRSLQQVSGVGALTALAFVLILEDPDRFAKSREVGPALGLVPRRDQSGDRDPQLPITKTGNAFLRRLLVGSAHHILGPFGPDCLCPARVRVTTGSQKTASEPILLFFEGMAAPTCPAGIPVGERTSTGTGLINEPTKSADREACPMGMEVRRKG